MGAFPDPRTGKAMIAPEYAKLHIDLLGILDDKTRGNLSEAEKTMLTRTLQELRAEFVELVRAVDKAVAEGKIAPMQQGGAPGGAPGGIVTPPSAGGGRIIGA